MKWTVRKQPIYWCAHEPECPKTDYCLDRDCVVRGDHESAVVYVKKARNEP